MVSEHLTNSEIEQLRREQTGLDEFAREATLAWMAADERKAS